MYRAIFTLILFLAPSWIAPLAAQSRSLDAFIERQMDRAHVAGLAAGIVKDGELVWSAGYGLADAERVLPVTPDTPFNLASVSKTITGTAVMQLVEDGRLDLDVDVSRYLPFRLRHPRHRGKKVTTRQLLTHTASLQDDEDLMDEFYVDGDSPIPLRRLLRDYFHPKGRYYDAGFNFYRAAPGRRFEYSNFGYAMLGLIVEGVASQPFDAYCRENVFQPLSMTSTSWRLRRLDASQVAMPYEFRGGRFIPYGHYGYPDYPNGLLRSSVKDLAHFVVAHLQNGRFSGRRILEPTTARSMRTVQNPKVASDMGLALFTDRIGGVEVWGHNGGDYGASTQMWLAPAQGFGVILLANGDAERPAEDRALTKVLERLIAEARKF